jgi:hypothetical protein
MKISKLIAILSLTTVMGAVAPALAETDSGGPPTDDSGVSTLGIDIRHFGGSPENVLAALSPSERRSLINNCESALRSPVDKSGTILSFCQGVTGAAPRTVLSFAEPRFRGFDRNAMPTSRGGEPGVGATPSPAPTYQ